MQQFLAQTGSNSSAATSRPASPQPRLRQTQAPRKERDPQNKEKEAPPPAMADEHQDLTRAFAGMVHYYILYITCFVYTHAMR